MDELHPARGDVQIRYGSGQSWTKVWTGQECYRCRGCHRVRVPALGASTHGLVHVVVHFVLGPHSQTASAAGGFFVVASAMFRIGFLVSLFFFKQKTAYEIGQ